MARALIVFALGSLLFLVGMFLSQGHTSRSPIEPRVALPSPGVDDVTAHRKASDSEGDSRRELSSVARAQSNAHSAKMTLSYAWSAEGLYIESVSWSEDVEVQCLKLLAVESVAMQSILYSRPYLDMEDGLLAGIHQRVLSLGAGYSELYSGETRPAKFSVELGSSICLFVEAKIEGAEVGGWVLVPEDSRGRMSPDLHTQYPVPVRVSGDTGPSGLVLVCASPIRLTVDTTPLFQWEVGVPARVELHNFSTLWRYYFESDFMLSVQGQPGLAVSRLTEDPISTIDLKMGAGVCDVVVECIFDSRHRLECETTVVVKQEKDPEARTSFEKAVTSGGSLHTLTGAPFGGVMRIYCLCKCGWEGSTEGVVLTERTSRVSIAMEPSFAYLEGHVSHDLPDIGSNISLCLELLDSEGSVVGVTEIGNVNQFGDFSAMVEAQQNVEVSAVQGLLYLGDGMPYVIYPSAEKFRLDPGERVTLSIGPAVDFPYVRLLELPEGIDSDDVEALELLTPSEVGVPIDFVSSFDYPKRARVTRSLDGLAPGRGAVRHISGTRMLKVFGFLDVPNCVVRLFLRGQESYYMLVPG